MSTSRILYLDVLRAVSMFAVVYLHVAAPGLRQFDHMALWHFSNVLSSLFTVAVPLFFMISGALLLSNQSSAQPRSLFQNRLPRILVPFVLWSLIVVLFQVKEIGISAARESLVHIISQPVSTPYWFLYALIPLYLLSPLLRQFVENVSPALFRYALGLWFFFSVLLPTLQLALPPSYASVLHMNPVYHLNFLGGYIGYFLLGYGLHQSQGKFRTDVLALIVFLDAAFIAFATWKKSVPMEAYSEQFKSYLSLYVVVLAVALFLLARNFFQEKQFHSPLLPLLSGISFSIYLIHPRAITLIHLHLMNQQFSGILPQLMFYILTLLFSFLVSLLFASIKPLCWPLTGQKFSKAVNLQALLRLRHRQ